ncbi:metallophosphoesterase family protein [Maritalea porphyrae]|uniref:metallophosphoesterase family protein n=1 Tax=Maritalea porphyrae TaxID=880732 RepID=UPI0022AFDC95|nr:metallophosphoesterase [Maritalea porphyrae]MCZ4273578.1 metallophosphoesterase [Maritalea porphyrae]
MTKVAHISDVHLGPLPTISPFELMNKRLTGYANWKLSRHGNMQQGLLAQLSTHLKLQKPELIALSGDLVNLALPGEFEAARAWLEDLGPAEQIAVIPGNHDAYVKSGLEEAAAQWGDYMKGMTLSDHQFPYWRQEGCVALIGCSSAITTPPFFAHGEFDEAQAERLIDILKLTRDAGLYRIVMIHHPPHDDVKQIWRRGLKGRKLFRKVIKDQGAELVLHGHLHRSMIHPLEGPTGDIPLIGIASAAAGNGGKYAPARYNLFDVHKVGSKFECQMSEFGFQRIGDGITKRLEMMLD